MNDNASSLALIDNSAFAGVMRLYCPEIGVHQQFLRNYPAHRIVDEQSLADFLSGLCLYDKLVLETGSVWNEKELKREGYGSIEQPIDGLNASWVEQLKGQLPTSVRETIGEVSINANVLNESESSAKAFDIMTSPLKNEIVLAAEDKIPNVYFAKDYMYRKRFKALNRANRYPLNEQELAQAMFLHRGLFLQSYAHAAGCVYLPYHLRGKMLSKLPPMTWVRAPRVGHVQVHLPLAEGTRVNETDYVRQLNEYYYSLIQSVTWTTYSSEVPFIGAAILAAAGGSPRDAINIAMDYREKGHLRTRLAELNRAIKSLDRPRFESLLQTYKDELAAAARHFGAKLPNSQYTAFYELAISWLPKPAAAAIKAAVELLPESIKHWGYQLSSTLVTQTPLQILFMSHISAIRQQR